MKESSTKQAGVVTMLVVIIFSSLIILSVAYVLSVSFEQAAQRDAFRTYQVTSLLACQKRTGVPLR